MKIIEFKEKYMNSISSSSIRNAILSKLESLKEKGIINSETTLKKYVKIEILNPEKLKEELLND